MDISQGTKPSCSFISKALRKGQTYSTGTPGSMTENVLISLPLIPDQIHRTIWYLAAYSLAPEFQLIKVFGVYKGQRSDLCIHQRSSLGGISLRMSILQGSDVAMNKAAIDGMALQCWLLGYGYTMVPYRVTGIYDTLQLVVVDVKSTNPIQGWNCCLACLSQS